jgi:hypothetical protein
MDDQHKGAAWMTVGLVIQLAALFLIPREQEMARQIVGYGAAGFLVAGGAKTASAKGYSPWLGLLGFLSFVGMGILLLIPFRDSFRRTKPEKKADTEADTEEA